MLAERFELRRQVAEDASTVTWEGFDHALDRRVLIKLLRSELAGDPRAIERFRQESRTAARAGSTDERRVLDAGFDQRSAVPFVVFEWQARSTGPDAPEPAPHAETEPLVPQSVRRVPSAQPVHPTAKRYRNGGLHLIRRLALLLLIVPVVATGLFVRRVLDDSGSAASRFPPLPTVTLATPAPAVSRQTPVATLASVNSATSRPTAAPAILRPTPSLAATARRRIVNTDGIGVALRASPGGDRLPGKGYDEGATVTFLEQSGEWSHIRGDDGREGWVLSVTLG